MLKDAIDILCFNQISANVSLSELNEVVNVTSNAAILSPNDVTLVADILHNVRESQATFTQVFGIKDLAFPVLTQLARWSRIVGFHFRVSQDG